MLTGIPRLALGAVMGLLTSCALESPSLSAGSSGDDIAAGDGEEAGVQAVCNGPIRCFSYVQTVGSGVGRRIHTRAATPIGFGAIDLQRAYKINPKRLATTTKPTIAIVDAYGYPKLEADLAVYRSQYGLPACTVANGCLTIVNQEGQTSPLPVAPPPDDDWTIETALDVDMASAACPLCNILVVQAADDVGNGLFLAQTTAVKLGASVISDSWGAAEQNPGDFTAVETLFDHPKTAIFVASGDHGYNDTIILPGNRIGPNYPGTSQYTISVGATRLVKDATTARGWTETAWSLAVVNGSVDLRQGAGGSACSLSIPKPAYQTASPCAYKATVDVSAVGDPTSGVAVYNTHGTNGGWMNTAGTSASAPFVAAIMAATGNGAQTSGAFFAQNTTKLWDVTSGTNGTCPGKTLLCNATVGWDGPTGYGTPNASAFMGSADMEMVNGPGAGGNSPDVAGGCSTGSSVGGIALGLALLPLRRRRRCWSAPGSRPVR